MLTVASGPAIASFGVFVRELREQRGLGLRQAVTLARARGQHELTLNRLGDIERGKTKNLEPEWLRDLADFYEMTYAAMLQEYVVRRYDIESGTAPDTSVHYNVTDMGGRVAAAETRALQQQLAAARKTIRDMRVAAKRIAVTLGKQIALAEGFETRRPQSGRSPHR